MKSWRRQALFEGRHCFCPTPTTGGGGGLAGETGIHSTPCLLPCCAAPTLCTGTPRFCLQATALTPCAQPPAQGFQFPHSGAFSTHGGLVKALLPPVWSLPSSCSNCPELSTLCNTALKACT